MLALNKVQPYWVPKFTKVGFEKVPIPPEIYSEILMEYETLKSQLVEEGCSWFINNCEDIVSDGEESSLRNTQRTYLMQLRYFKSYFFPFKTLSVLFVSLKKRKEIPNYFKEYL